MHSKRYIDSSVDVALIQEPWIHSGVTRVLPIYTCKLYYNRETKKSTNSQKQY